MQLVRSDIDGCFLLKANVLSDARGDFTKCFHEPDFSAFGLRTDWREEYFSYSRRDVLRGMHFQTPPAQHSKMVFCLSGCVMDVVLDLRLGSSTYGKHLSFKLSRGEGVGLYLEEGLAHGFLGLDEENIMLYRVTSVFSPEHDKGVHWNSFGCDWPISSPIISDRDRSHPRFDSYISPFVLDEAR